MSWVVFRARGTRFFPVGGGGSRRGKESNMWLEKRRRKKGLISETNGPGFTAKAETVKI